MSELKKKYLRGLHWLANAQIQVEPENKVLSLVTCLETFFSPSKDSGLPISNSIAEAIALLVEKGFESRSKLKKRIKELYDLRSRITHGGSIEISQDDIGLLKGIAYWSMKYVFNKFDQYTTLDEIRKEVENLRLS